MRFAFVSFVRLRSRPDGRTSREELLSGRPIRPFPKTPSPGGAAPAGPSGASNEPPPTLTANTFRMKTRWTLLALLLGSLGLTAQPVAAYDIDTDGDGNGDGILYRDEVYTSAGDLVFYADHLGGPGSFTYATDVELYNGNLTDLKLDLYYADFGSDSLAAKDKPVIFFFYGGGFSEGTSIRVKDLCIQYASRGYVTVAPNYRLGYYGAYPEDSADICQNLRSVTEAPYRAMLDAQAAMRWVRDNAGPVLGLDVSPDHFFVHGPSFFPMLSHMQSDEVHPALHSIGMLDDSVKIRASVGRSAGINLINEFIDADDTAPFLIFQGTCDKSVPFSKFSLASRFGCDSLGTGTVPGDNIIYGSYLIAQTVNHYFEYYPICGLHHSLKDIEENEMREPVAEFLYNMTAGNIAETAAPVIQPYIVAPCDVNGQCAGEDRFGWCNSAIQLPPEGGSCIREGRYRHRVDMPFKLDEPAGLEGTMVFPNPTQGPITLTFEASGEGMAHVTVFDAFGRRYLDTRVYANEGLNVHRLELPANAPTGAYVLQVNGRESARFLKR
jgi:hypothetical protein